MDGARMALAFVARRQASRVLPRTRWAHVLSLELGWMSPGQATAYVDRAAAAGLLRSQGEALELAFDPANVEVPRGFRPDPLEAPAPAAPDPFVDWLDKVAAATRRSRADVLADVEERQRRMGGMLTAETALLWSAAEAGLDVREAAQRSLDSLTAPKGQAGPAAAGTP